MGIYFSGILLQLASFIVLTWSNINDTDFIPPDYIKDIPPPPDEEDGKHHVRLSIRFINLLEVNELTSYIQLSCFFRVYWVDSRLRAQLVSKPAPLVVPRSAVSKLWRPDIIAENTLMTVNNGIIRPTIFNGRFWGHTLFVSNYISIRIGCSFQYESYPFDVQICRLAFTNMGMVKSDMHLDWANPPYSMDRNTFLTYQDRFKIRLCEDRRDNVRRTKLGEHPQKTLLIVMERDYSIYVVELFVPTVIFVLVAWLSILVPPTMLRTRLLLNTTNLLTLFTLFMAISHAENLFIPKISYLTALSLWMYVCVVFVFTSMLVVILDIRLIVILTQPRRKRRVRKMVMGVYRRRVAPLGSMLAVVPGEQNEGDDRVTVSTARISTSVRLRRQASEFLADDTDVDAIWSALTRPAPDVSVTSVSEDDEIAYRGHVWLAITDFYEQIYLLAFPVFFCLFLILYFGFFLRARRLSLDQVLETVRALNSSHGCWCTDEDDWIGCMAKHQYRV